MCFNEVKAFSENEDSCFHLETSEKLKKKKNRNGVT